MITNMSETPKKSRSETLAPLRTGVNIDSKVRLREFYSRGFRRADTYRNTVVTYRNRYVGGGNVWYSATG
jgi:hypothetical protein